MLVEIYKIIINILLEDKKESPIIDISSIEPIVDIITDVEPLSGIHITNNIADLLHFT